MLFVSCSLPPVSPPLPQTGEVVGLAATALRPQIGEELRLEASWAGPWPPQIQWHGVDRAEGSNAWLRPDHLGPLTVQAGSQMLQLNVQPAISIALPSPEVDLRPLNRVETGCPDDRLPGLAGHWVVWCVKDRVDHAMDLEHDTVVELKGPARPALGPGLLYAAGLGQGLWRLPSATADPAVALVAEPGTALSATDGRVVLIPRRDAVERLPLDQRFRTLIPAQPLLHEPVALADTYAAWIALDPQTGRDVWLGLPDGHTWPLARSLGREGWLAGSGHWLGWVDPEGVVVENLTQHERRRYPADTGFLHPLSLWGPTACWEDRAALRAGTGDIDLACSDGLRLQRPGHQTAPWRWGPWLLFQEGSRVMLATYRAIVLDDSDPRAEGPGATLPGGFGGSHREGPVFWELDWPASGWRVEYWQGDWRPGEALAPGHLRLSDPGGDAIRLVPQ